MTSDKQAFAPLQANLGSIPVGESVEAQLSFTPPNMGVFKGMINVSAFTGVRTINVSAVVTGKGVDAMLTFDLEFADFGKVYVGDSNEIRV